MSSERGVRSDGVPSATSHCVGVAVHAVRSSPRGPELLFVRRSGGRFAGQWWPVTGTREAPEQPAECATRELHEETGLVPLALHTTERRAPAEGGHLEVFLARIDPAAEVVLNWEHDDHQWCSREEALARVPESARDSIETACRILEVQAPGASDRSILGE